MHIAEFQEMMKTLYFLRDSERGWKGTYDWLVDEVKELGEALEGTDEEATQKEFADVIAWLASLANVVRRELGESSARTNTRINAQSASKPPANAPSKTKRF